VTAKKKKKATSDSCGLKRGERKSTREALDKYIKAHGLQKEFRGDLL
jgi:hypothetical protein